MKKRASKESRLSKETLANYKKWLPHGSIKIIAEKSGFKHSTVSSFLNGYSDSWEIEKAILSFIADLKAEREELQRKAGFIEQSL